MMEMEMIEEEQIGRKQQHELEEEHKEGGHSQEGQSQPAVYFEGKLRIYNEINLNKLKADVLVNFCASDILSGDEIFLKVHELAGEELKNFAARYQGIGIGSCRLSDSFGLKNFKRVAHCILPRPIQGDLVDLDELVEYDLMLCYRNALDLSMENGYNSIMFTHPLLYADRYGMAKLAIALLSYWMEKSLYAGKLQHISIACPSEEINQCYVEIITDLANRGWEEFVLSHSSPLYTYLLESFNTETDSKFEYQSASAPSTSSRKPIFLEVPEYDEAMADIQMLEAVFEREFAPLEFIEEQQVPFDSSLYHPYQKRKYKKTILPFDENEDPNLMMPYENPNLNQFCIERYGFDEMYIREHPDEVYDMLFRSPDGLQLQLSRNLSATILTIEEEQGGMVRQYRMTTQNREGETLYFRCSRCESVMRYTTDEYRPKITVRDGFIYGDCYPMHHPQCYPVTKEWVILQQLDRQARLYMYQTSQKRHSLRSQMHEEGVEDGNGFATEATTSGEVVAASGVEYEPVTQFLTGQQPRQFGHSSNLGTDMKTEMVGDQQSGSASSARTRLRPAMTDQESMPQSATATRRLPISVATPRFNVYQRTPNEVPILYKRKEAPESATLRAIRKCENELEGRVSEELDRALAVQENIDFWKNPTGLGAAPQYLVSPLTAVLPHATRRGQRRQQQMGDYMELGHEEVVIGDSEEQQIEDGNEEGKGMNVSTDEQANGNGGDERMKMMPSTSSQSQQWQQQGEEEPHPILTAEVQLATEDQHLAAEDEARGRFQRKFRMIRKRGGQTGMAFDWREADLDGTKMKKAGVSK